MRLGACTSCETLLQTRSVLPYLLQMFPSCTPGFIFFRTDRRWFAFGFEFQPLWPSRRTRQKTRVVRRTGNRSEQKNDGRGRSVVLASLIFVSFCGCAEQSGAKARAVLRKHER